MSDTEAMITRALAALAARERREAEAERTADRLAEDTIWAAKQRAHSTATLADQRRRELAAYAAAGRALDAVTVGIVEDNEAEAARALADLVLLEQAEDERQAVKDARARGIPPDLG